MRNEVSSQSFRQTLLPFQPIDRRSPPVSSQQIYRAPPKPLPPLPWEITERILASVGSLHLKTFRLVCRDWSILGAKRLFSTLYLNGFEKCWSGLIAVSESSYATLVERVVWNPIVLLPGALDSTTWYNRYQPLLKGVTHSNISRLFRRYCELHTHASDPMHPFPVGIIADALRKLSNCHEIMISEDYDLESRRSDPYFRSRFQYDDRFLQHQSIWACRPHWWASDDERIGTFSTLHGLLDAAAHCPTVTRLTIDLEAGNFNQIAKGQPWLSCHHIESLMLKLRYSVTYNDTRLDYPLFIALAHHVSWIRSFPSICDLHIQLELEDPWHDLADFFQQRLDRMATSDTSDDSDDPLDVAHTLLTPGSGDIPLHTQPIDFDSLVFDLEVDLRLLRLQRLRTLRLTNVIINMRQLLQIVCMYPHEPEWQLSIHLAQTTILYGLPATGFLDLLDQLNVRLFYEPLQTYHYTIIPLGDYQLIPTYFYSVGQTQISRWWSSRLKHDSWGEPDGPRNMPNQTESKCINIIPEFRSYVSDLKSFVLSYRARASPEPNSDIIVTYEMRIEDARIICGWVIGAPPVDGEWTPGSSRTIVPISTARLLFCLSDLPIEYSEVEGY